MITKRTSISIINAFLLFLCFQFPSFSEVHTLFSQKGSLIQELVDYIDAEQKEIDIALYAFTHRDVLKALASAHDRGVRLKVLLDPSSASMAKKLNHFAVEVSLFCPEKRLKCLCSLQQVSALRQPQSGPPLMHHKFFLFHDNKGGRSWVWTGSFNCTYSAENLHLENAVVLDDPKAFNAFKEQFDQVRKEFSEVYQGSRYSKPERD